MHWQILVLFGIYSCGHLSGVHIGSIEYLPGYERVPFSYSFSEKQASIDDSETIPVEVKQKRSQQNQLSTTKKILRHLQTGPKTGDPTYMHEYSDHAIHEIFKRCPSGNITGLVSYRESAKKSAIPGEVVRIDGFCLKKIP